MMGAFSIIPVSVVLAISFIVIVLLEKTKGVVRLFGLIVVVLLFTSAVLSTYTLATGKCSMRKMMKKHNMYKDYGHKWMKK